MSESKLNIVIDSRTAEQKARDLTRVLEALEQAGIRVSRTLSGQITGNNANAAAAGRNAGASASAAAANNAAAASAARAVQENNRLTSSLQSVTVGLIGVGAAFTGLQKAMAAADEYTNISNKLKLISDSQEQLNMAMRDTFSIAQETAQRWEAVNDVYSKYAFNAEALNLTQAETTRITQITSKAIAISGSTSQAAAGALFQYGQALDGNILRAQEYNSLVDGAGGLLTAMATGLGVTRGELRQMMLDGKLTGEVVSEALLKAGDSVDALYAKTATTIGGGMTQVSNAFTKFIGEADSGAGASAILVKSLGALANSLEVIADTGAALAIGYLTKVLVGGGVAAYNGAVALGANRAAAIAAAAANTQLAASALITAQANTASAASQLALAEAHALTLTGFARVTYAERTLIPLRAASVAATEAETAASATHAAALNAEAAAASRATAARAGAMAMLGGPVGLIALVAAVGAGMYFMSDGTEDATKAIDRQGKSVADLSEEYKKLSLAQAISESKNLRTELADQEKAILSARQSMLRYIAGQELLLSMDAKPAAELRELIFGIGTNANKAAAALDTMRKSGKYDQDVIDRMAEYVNKLTESKAKADSAAAANYMLKSVTNNLTTAATGAADAIAATGKAADDAAGKVAELSKEMQSYIDNTKQGIFSSTFQLSMRGQGYSPDVSKALADATAANGNAPLSQEQVRLVLAGVEANDRLEASNKRIADAAKAASADRKLENRQAINDQKELMRELERRRDAYADLRSESSTPEQQADADFKEREALIKEFANRSNGEYTRMTNWAVSERDREVASIRLSHAKTLASYENLGKSEIDQIRSKYAFERSEVDLMITYTLDERRKMREALDQAEKTEIKKYGEAEQEKADALRASFDERYRIQLDFENRLKAIDQSNLSDPEKEMAANVARNVNNDAITGLNKPYTDMMAEVGGESPELLRLKADEEAKMIIIRDALTQRHITEEEAAAARLQIEKDFMTSRNDLLMSQGEQMLGSMTGIMKSLAGEQSKAYKVMFAMEKGMSIARSIMAIQTGIAMAAANPFPMNIGAMASVAAATANIVSSIQSIKMAGQAHDGIDYVPKEGTWLLDKGERVLSPKQNSDLTNYMQRDAKSPKSDTVVAGGGINITIENHTSAKFEVQQLSESEVRIIAREEIARDGGKTAASSMSNPNSEMSKAMTRNLQVERNRS